MGNARILIVDDESAVRRGIRRALSKNDYDLYEAENGSQAFQLLKSDPPDLVLLDMNMPEYDGLETLKKISELENKPLVIMITAYGSEKIAVEAMKRGAFDYLRKPYEIDELRLSVKNALKTLHLERENLRLIQALKQYENTPGFIAQSEVMKQVFQRIQKVSESSVTVMLLGENGTGKEVVARAIHEMSSRKQFPFVAVNCAAMPDELIESELFGHEKGAFTGALETRIGKFEMAHHGTLFLDEFGDMSAKTQAKLLRVLEERKFTRLGGNVDIEVDVRVISATNKNLEVAIQKQEFREDLYYRLKVVDIHLPPLRERKEDIFLLASRFGEQFSQKYHKGPFQIEPEAIKSFERYFWPGNVRELRNLIEKQIVLSQDAIIRFKDLPANFQEVPAHVSSIADTIEYHLPFKDAKKNWIYTFERHYIERKLLEFKGNISQTAQALDMHRQSLQQKLKELGIQAKDYADSEK